MIPAIRAIDTQPHYPQRHFYPYRADPPASRTSKPEPVLPRQVDVMTFSPEAQAILAEQNSTFQAKD